MEETKIDLVEVEASKEQNALEWAKEQGANTELEYQPGTYLTLTEKSYNALVAFALALADRDIQMSGKMQFITSSGVAIPLSVAVNLANEDKPYRATLKAIFESLASYAGGQALAAAGAGTISLSFGSVFVGYAAVVTANDLIDRYIGVSATADIRKDRKTYQWEVASGKISDFLRPRGGIAQFFDGLFWDTDANVWDEYDLVNAESWVLKHANNNEEPLKIEYSKGEGFIFNGIPAQNLSSLYHSSKVVKGDRFILHPFWVGLALY